MAGVGHVTDLIYVVFAQAVENFHAPVDFAFSHYAISRIQITVAFMGRLEEETKSLAASILCSAD